MSRKSVLTPLVSLLMVITILLTACAPQATVAPTDAPKAEEATKAPEATKAADPTKAPEPTAVSEPVEISYIYPNGIQADVDAVSQAMSEYLTAKGINIKITLAPVDWGAYTDKVNLMVSAGEACDLLFVAPWMGPSYAQLVANGALLPLNDLLDTNAAELVASMPAGALDATKINGNIYGVPNQQIWVKPFGPAIRKDLADKYAFDTTTLKKLEDLEPYLKAVKEGDPDIFPANGGSYIGELFGWDPIVTQSVQVSVAYNDSGLKVFNAYDTPEFKSLVELMYKWYSAGYFPQDIIPAEEYNNQWKAGKLGLDLLGVVKPGGDLEFKNNRGYDVYAVNISPVFMTTASVTATMNGVCSTSKNPEVAVQVLNLLNTDVGFYNLLAKGIEGKHWVWVDQAANIIGPGPEKDNYNPGTDWMFGSVFNAYYNDPAYAEIKFNEATAKVNADAAVSVALGFSFNPDPVKNELAQVSAVVKELGEPLIAGQVDPATALPEFIQALKDAGIDAIVAEAQAQLNAWAGK